MAPKTLLVTVMYPFMFAQLYRFVLIMTALIQISVYISFPIFCLWKNESIEERLDLVHGRQYNLPITSVLLIQSIHNSSWDQKHVSYIRFTSSKSVTIKSLADGDVLCTNHFIDPSKLHLKYMLPGHGTIIIALYA